MFLHPDMSVLVEVLIIALQLPRLSYMVLPFSTTTLVRPEQPQKASLPMLVTLLGIVTIVRLEQPEKASLPMLVTLLGIVTLVRPEQLEKAPPATCSMPAGIEYAPE